MIRPTYLPEDALQLEGVEPSESMRAKLTGQKVMLCFSRGKDSIAAWLAMAQAGIEVIPVYRYGEPKMRFVEENLKYFEELFGTHIYRVPNMTMYLQLNNKVDQPPERAGIIDAAGIITPTYREINDWVMDYLGLDKATTWVADGVRATDSPNRRRAMAVHGPWTHSEMQVHIVWDWKTAHCWESMKQAGVQTPPDYSMWKRSFDGTQYDYSQALKMYHPEDYQLMLRWFPMVEADYIRYHRLSRSHSTLKRRKDAVE